MSSANDVSFKVGTVKVRIDVSKSSGNSDPIPPILKDNNGASVVKLKNFNGTVCVSDNKKNSFCKTFKEKLEWDINDKNTMLLHELCAEPHASLDEIRLAMNKNKDSICLPDLDGKLPIHYLSLNKLLYERSREEVEIIASDLLNYFPKSILHPDYSGRIPFSESITSWVKGFYEESDDNVQYKTPESDEEIMNNIIPESISVPALVEWAFMFFSDVLDQCNQEMRNEIASCIVGIPYLVKTVLLISDNNEMYKILDCSLFRRVILHPETIECWFITMLKADKVKALRVVHYFEMLDSSMIIHYIGKRKEPTPSDRQFFQENRAEIFNRITSQKELIPALFNLSSVDIRRVALTKVVQEALDIGTSHLFISSFTMFDFILHVTLLIFIRSIAMFNGVLILNQTNKMLFECGVCEIEESNDLWHKLMWHFNYDERCEYLNCGGTETKSFVESMFLRFVVTFCICGYFILREISCSVALAKVSDITAYFGTLSSLWRVSQLTSVVMSTIMAIICFWDIGKDNLGIPLSITVFLLWFSFFYYLIILYRPISLFLLSTVETLRSIKVFFVVLFVHVCAFGDIFNVSWTSEDCFGAVKSTGVEMNDLNGWEESIANNPFCSSNSLEPIFYMYSVVLKQYDVEYFRVSMYDQCMFVLFTGITTFILLNYLAAAVIESQQKMKSKVESAYGACRIDFLTGNLALLNQLDQYGENSLTQGFEFGSKKSAERTTLFLSFFFLFSFITTIVFAIVVFEAFLFRVDYEYVFGKLILNTDISMRRKLLDGFDKININKLNIFLKDEGDANDWSGRLVEIERFTTQIFVESEVRINQNVKTAGNNIIADGSKMKSDLETLIKNAAASLNRKKKKTPLS